MNESVRKLSIPRLIVLLTVVVGLPIGLFFGRNYIEAQKSTSPQKPWFGSYVDVTAVPSYSFQQMGDAGKTNAVLSFVVASRRDPCIPTWGTAYTLDQANASLSLDTRIARLQQQGSSVAISFGGRDNNELATVCTDPDKLAQAYRSVIDRYKIDTIDLDLEGEALSDQVSATRRAQVMAQLQTERRQAGKGLAIWLTLPVTPQGMSETGTAAVSVLLENKVDLAGVNLMTMDYGQSLPAGQSMGEASKSALTQGHRQLGILYQQAGLTLNDATLWSKIGATPMIGQNDIAGEVFGLADAKELNSFAQDKQIGRLSMWSANRDIACGSNYTTLKIVSDSCSGVAQEDREFASLLGKELAGTISENSHRVTNSGTATKTEEIVDDPAHSPYQIWTKEGAYLQGTKVVWHRNVYQAKWWTQGEIPDNPVLQVWQTPWELIGPVLPSDTPIPQPTLPPGTYPEWDGKAVYNAGQRVLFSGVPYQAKWWTQGNSPAAASSNPASSPWVPLTQAQIEEIGKQIK